MTFIWRACTAFFSVSLISWCLYELPTLRPDNRALLHPFPPRESPDNAPYQPDGNRIRAQVDSGQGEQGNGGRYWEDGFRYVGG